MSQARTAHPRCRRRSGLTLVECLVASLVLALSASAALVAMSAGLQHQRNTQEQRVAAQLAQHLLERVAARAYLDPADPDYLAEEADSAQAMDGYSDQVDAAGQPATGPEAYQRVVAVSTASDAGIAAVPGAGLAVVTVTTPSGRALQLKRLLHMQ